MPECTLCGRLQSKAILDEAAWLDQRVVDRLARAHPQWRRRDGACPACVQEALLETVLLDGRTSLEGRLQKVWPLDAEAAFGAIPIPLRLRADPRFKGRGTTIALVDAGFFPHPDLVRPDNRIVAWVDASADPVRPRFFTSDDVPSWPEVGVAGGGQWHGLMTSVTAAGNGWLGHGLYRGLAAESGVVLVQVSDGQRITAAAIERALAWLGRHASELRLRVVSVSGAADDVDEQVDAAVAALVADGIVIVAAAGNDGTRRLVSPATAAAAITVGGLDDRNVVSSREWQIWHSNFGETRGRIPKPEVVAPSMWTVAPILPATDVADEARLLFKARAQAAATNAERRITELRLVTPHYQHVEGTSFAAPVVAAIAACMCQANPRLTPMRIKELLMLSATRIPGAPDERQGAGAVDAGLAVAAALADEHATTQHKTPIVTNGEISFVLHDHGAQSVAVRGSWNAWQGPGAEASRIGDGVWKATIRCGLAARQSLTGFGHRRNDVADSDGGDSTFNVRASHMPAVSPGAEHCMTFDVAAGYASVPPEERSRAFFDGWTAKRLT